MRAKSTAFPTTMPNCVFPNGRFYILLLGNVEALLLRLEPLWFTYQHVDCLSTVFKNRFSGNFVVKKGQVFDNVETAVYFNHWKKGVDRMPSIPKNRPMREKDRKHLSRSFRKPTSTRNSKSVLAEGVDLVKKTKIELELIKIVDYFLEDNGKYTSYLINFFRNVS